MRLMGLIYSNPRYYVDKDNKIVRWEMTGLVMDFGEDALTMRTGTIFAPRITQILYKDIVSATFSPGIGVVDAWISITTPGGSHVAKLVGGYRGLDVVVNSIYERRDNAISRNGSGNASSAADEIAKYKNLADQGIITKEEFEKKKKQLLGI